MEPFKVSNELKLLSGSYPDAHAISKVAKQGGELARDAIARLWLSEGIPFAFKDCPGVYESVRFWLSTQLDVDPKEISLTGSARLGQSLTPGKKRGRAFGGHSDLDMFIVSETLFTRLRDDFNCWSYEFETGVVSATKAADVYWKDNLTRVPKNINKGFIDSKYIPNLDQYSHARKVNNIMYLLKKKLDVTESAPKVASVSLRCYKSWESYVRQVSLNLE